MLPTSTELTMLRYLILGFFLLTTVVIAYVGCGPRGQVAGKKILKKIDDILGELDVQLAKIETKKSSLDDQTDIIKKKLYTTEARLEKMQEDQDVREKEAKNLKSDLGQLKEYLTQAKDSGEVEIKGTAVSKERLIGWATDKAKALKRINGRIESKSKLIAVFEKNLTLYKSQVKVSQTNLAKLDDQIDEIKAKKEALDDTRRATLLDGKSVSINDEFADLTKEVDELLINVDASLKLENDKLEERISEVEMEAGNASLDELLDDKSDVDKAMSEIDALLGDG
jgi:chromosome segregation ATPase